MVILSVFASLFAIGCSAPAEPTEGAEGAAESELSGSGARFVETGDWKLAKVAYRVPLWLTDGNTVYSGKFIVVR